jgi:hypothetical protein
MMDDTVRDSLVTVREIKMTISPLVCKLVIINGCGTPLRKQIRGSVDGKSNYRIGIQLEILLLKYAIARIDGLLELDPTESRCLGSHPPNKNL